MFGGGGGGGGGGGADTEFRRREGPCPESDSHVPT